MENKIKIIKAICNIYKESNNKEDSIFSYLLNWAFRDITNAKPVEYVSKAALQMAKEKKVDLSKANYSALSKLDPNKEWLYYEHCNPIKELRLALLNDNKEVEKIIEKDFICWVTREENKELDKRGYRDKRPGGWKKCYKECGIKVLENKGDLYV